MKQILCVAFALTLASGCKSYQSITVDELPSRSIEGEKVRMALSNGLAYEGTFRSLSSDSIRATINREGKGFIRAGYGRSMAERTVFHWGSSIDKTPKTIALSDLTLLETRQSNRSGTVATVLGVVLGLPALAGVLLCKVRNRPNNEFLCG